MPVAQSRALLSPDDPDPVEICNPDGAAPFVLVCEHAGQAIPRAFGDLGVAARDRARHIGWDIGAEGVARRLSTLLDAPLVLQRYSRLFVDCNRPFDAPDCVPAASDGTPVPGNRDLGEEDRRRRFDAVHRPFHEAVEGLIDRRVAAGEPPVLVAVHSFTPRLADGPERPWHLGVLANRDPSFAERLLVAFRESNPAAPAAYNEPYVVDDLSDYTIPVHGEARGLPHVLIEIRNDLIGDEDGQADWAGRLAHALADATFSPES